MTSHYVNLFEGFFPKLIKEGTPMEKYEVRWYISHSKKKTKTFSIKRWGTREEAHIQAWNHFEQCFGFRCD